MHSTTPPQEAPTASPPIQEPGGGAKLTKKRNTRKKGDRLERKAAKLLREAEHRVELRPTRARFFEGRVHYVPTDWFGRFDLLAVKGGAYRWVQVIHDVSDEAAKARRELEADAAVFLQREFAIPRVTVEMWRWRAGQAKSGDKLPRGWIAERYNLAAEKWQRVEPGTGAMYHRGP